MHACTGSTLTVSSLVRRACAGHWGNLGQNPWILGRKKIGSIRIRTNHTSLRHTATRCNTLQHAATRCNTLQHAVTRCNTLQHAATRSNTFYDFEWIIYPRDTLQHTADFRCFWGSILLRFVNFHRLESIYWSFSGRVQVEFGVFFWGPAQSPGF